MAQKRCCIVGIPIQCGTHINGCVMGPDSFRTANLADTLTEQGASVFDYGNLQPIPQEPMKHENANIRHLSEIVAWTKTIEAAAYEAISSYDLPVFVGGDHSLSAGTIPGVTRHAAEHNKEQFVLWLDAHPDFHTLSSTESGNLHGTPVAYFSGQAGFDGYYPSLQHKVPEQNICMMGVRSIDTAEQQALSKTKIQVLDMRYIDDHGFPNPLTEFLERVKKANGSLHVSLDVDFLEPEIAPAVGTTVAGGATFREAHHIMEMLHESELVTSLDLVELNPFLDERGKTATLMVDLVASLMGRKILHNLHRRYG